MNVPGWGPVVIDLAGLDLSAPQVSILANHNATRKGVVLHGRAEIDNHRLTVAGQISVALCLCTTNVELAFFLRAFVSHLTCESAGTR